MSKSKPKQARLTGLDEARHAVSRELTTSFLDPTDYYLNRETMKAVKRGKNSAFYVPAVDFVLGMTIATFSQPQMEAQLPREIIDRSGYISILIDQIVYHALRQQLFYRAYAYSPHLSGLITPAREMHLNGMDGKDYLLKLCNAPFMDIQTITGGAQQALWDSGVTNNGAEIIAASSELSIISGVPKDEMKRINEAYRPYMPPENFLVSAGDTVSIRYSNDFDTQLRTYFGPDNGCPANLTHSTRDGPSVLTQRWAEMSKLIVGANPTVNYDYR